MNYDEQIACHAQELVKAILASGRSIQAVNDSGHVDIWLFSTGTQIVENTLNGWRVPFQMNKEENPLLPTESLQGETF